VRPEEIPEIPSHKFLFRGSPPKKAEADRSVLLDDVFITLSFLLAAVLKYTFFTYFLNLLCLCHLGILCHTK